MQIFKHRPLCLIISFLIAFTAVSQFIPVATKLLIVLAAAGISVLFLLLLKQDKAFWHRVGIWAVGILLLLCVVVRTFFFYDMSYRDVEKLYGLSGKAEIKITEVIYSGKYNTIISGIMISFDKVTVQSGSLNLRVYLECEYEADFDAGDTVELSVELFAPELLLEDGHTARITLLSEGYVLYCSSNEDSAIMKEQGSGIKYYLEKLNKRLCARFEYILGEDVGSLASAIALGNDSKVDDDVIRDFGRSGLAHILALSGSHIVLIIGSAETVLRKCARAKKKIRYPLMILSLPLYIMLVTSPIPVIRAGIMYGVFCLLQIFGKKSDSMTNLFISAFIMIFVKPSLVFSVSLWMSFLATLALIVFIPPVNEIMHKIKQKKRAKLLTSVFVTAVLTVFTAVIGLLSNVIFLPLFGTFSTVSISANIIFGPLLTVFLSLAMILLLCMPFSYAPKILTIPLIKLGKFILDGIHDIASDKYSVVSLNAGFSKILCIIFFMLMVLLLIVKVKHKFTLFVPAFVFALLLSVSTFGFVSDRDEVHIVDIKRNLSETMVVSRGDDFSIIDISDGRYTNFSKAVRIAKERGACEFESIVLTHYHKNHISSLQKLIDKECIRLVILPPPNNMYDNEIYVNLTKMLDSADIPHRIYLFGGPYDIMNGVSISASPLERIKRSTHALVSFSLTFNEKELLYVGASVDEGEIYESVYERAGRAHKIILGRHGPVQKTNPVYIFSSYATPVINDDLIATKYLTADFNGFAYVDKDGTVEFSLK